MTNTFSLTKYPHPKSGEIVATQDLANGVFITFDVDREPFLEKISTWFLNRPEVVVVDHGTTDKSDLQFIMLEWMEQEIDQAFLEILENDEDVDDYTLYTRDLEEEED